MITKVNLDIIDLDIHVYIIKIHSIDKSFVFPESVCESFVDPAKIACISWICSFSNTGVN